jgi:hypothetical protein
MAFQASYTKLQSAISLFAGEIPCSCKKIPCSGRQNSLFRAAQGIGVQAFDLSHRLDTKSAPKGRIRKNSLLNSLFSGRTDFIYYSK